MAPISAFTAPVFAPVFAPELAFMAQGKSSRAPISAFTAPGPGHTPRLQYLLCQQISILLIVKGAGGVILLINNPLILSIPQSAKC
jgi:hypothetical protein